MRYGLPPLPDTPLPGDAIEGFAVVGIARDSETPQRMLIAYCDAHGAVWLRAHRSMRELGPHHPHAAKLTALPKTPQVGMYRHAKGGLYEMTTLARLATDPNQVYALYRTQRGDLWARPHGMWSERVQQAGQTVLRFTPIT